MPTIQSTKHFTCRQAHPTPLPILLFKTRTLTLLPLLLFKKTFPVTLMQALWPLRLDRIGLRGHIKWVISPDLIH